MVQAEEGGEACYAANAERGLASNDSQPMLS